MLVAEEVDVLVQNLKEKLRVGGKQSQVKNSNQRVKDLLKAGEAVKVVDLAEEHPVLRKQNAQVENLKKKLTQGSKDLNRFNKRKKISLLFKSSKKQIVKKLIALKPKRKQ